MLNDQPTQNTKSDRTASMFIAEQRTALQQLESFMDTPDYRADEVALPPHLDLTAALTNVIVAYRALLHKLEAFVATPGYLELETALQTRIADGAGYWLAWWLIERRSELTDEPLYLISRPGGIAQVAAALEQAASDGFFRVDRAVPGVLTPFTGLSDPQGLAH